MHNIGTIFRREVAAYFIGPVGYVFLAAFVLFANLLGLFVIGPGFFQFPIADMRQYFHVVAGVSAFLIAAVAMRLWAEERKGNTYEMLLTLPMSAGELVLGKFFAALFFYALALFLTLTVPAMMMFSARPEVAAGAAAYPWYGLLDLGATTSGYIGLLLLGATFIAFGLFVSSLCSDQIVAFVLTAPTLFFAYLLGLPYVGQALEQALSFIGPGVGSALSQYIGVFFHFDNLARGLLDLGDILFFLVWTILFLVLNALSLGRRGQKGANALFAVMAILIVAVGAAANWVLVEAAFPRVDLTTDRVFTVADVSSRVLDKLPEKIRIRYHVTPRDKMPSALQELERNVRDQLDALVHASSGKVAYQVIYREVGEAGESGEARDAAANGLDKEVFRKIRPFPIEALDEGRATAQLVYSALEITYPSQEREAVILPCIMEQPRPPAVVGVGEIEYRVVDYALKVIRSDQPVVALYAPLEEMDPRIMMQYMQMGMQPPPPQDPWEYIEYGLSRMENFQVKRTRLTEQDPMPDEYDLLLVAAPEHLDSRQQYEINLALAKGKPVIVAAQKSTMSYVPDYDQVECRISPIETDIEGFLPDGIALSKSMLMSARPVTLNLPVQTILGPAPMAFPAWPMHAELLGDAFVGPPDMFRQVTRMRMPWAAPLDIDAVKLREAGIEYREILRSGADDWTHEFTETTVSQKDLTKPSGVSSRRYPIAALFSGRFPMRFNERPAWSNTMPDPASATTAAEPDAPAPIDSYEPKSGNLLLLGQAWAFNRELVRYPELTFLLNAVSHFLLDDDTLAVRALRDKEMSVKAMGALSPAESRWWKAAQVGGHALLLTCIGLVIWRFRLRRRETYLATLP